MTEKTVTFQIQWSRNGRGNWFDSGSPYPERRRSDAIAEVRKRKKAPNGKFWRIEKVTKEVIFP